MSTAGILSNRGDYYQKLIAFKWIPIVLSEANYAWMEIDATDYAVDDIVIGKEDGTLICCQCKKNQTDFHCSCVRRPAVGGVRPFWRRTERRDITGVHPN